MCHFYQIIAYRVVGSTIIHLFVNSTGSTISSSRAIEFVVVCLLGSFRELAVDFVIDVYTHSVCLSVSLPPSLSLSLPPFLPPPLSHTYCSNVHQYIRHNIYYSSIACSFGLFLLQIKSRPYFLLWRCSLATSQFESITLTPFTVYTHHIYTLHTLHIHSSQSHITHTHTTRTFWRIFFHKKKNKQ